ncbi:MAG: hypothetical protein ACKVH0_18015 [Alphaproteobacteria bacterium]
MTATNIFAESAFLELLDLSKTSGKLDPVLRSNVGSSELVLANAGLLVAGDRIALEILLQDGAAASAARTALEAVGMTAVHVEGRAASGWIDASALANLETLEIISFARAAYSQR